MHRFTAKELLIGGSVIVGALGTIVLQGPEIWHKVGWKTPAAHAAEIERVEVAFTDVLQEFRDEWRCDEYDEEVKELLNAQRAGDDSVETAERLRKLRELQDRRKCSNFDE